MVTPAAWAATRTCRLTDPGRSSQYRSAVTLASGVATKTAIHSHTGSRATSPNRMRRRMATRANGPIR